MALDFLSGFSECFPASLISGKIGPKMKQPGGTYNTLRIKFCTTDNSAFYCCFVFKKDNSVRMQCIERRTDTYTDAECDSIIEVCFVIQCARKIVRNGHIIYGRK